MDQAVAICGSFFRACAETDLDLCESFWGRILNVASGGDDNLLILVFVTFLHIYSLRWNNNYKSVRRANNRDDTLRTSRSILQ